MSSDGRTDLATYDLRVFWDRKGRDIMYDGPCGPDRHLMHSVLSCQRPRGGFSEGYEPSLLDELRLRGYDVTTLKLKVRRFRHPWISLGATIWHRKTGDKHRVHHVHYQTGVAQVLLMPPNQNDWSKVNWKDSTAYLPLEVVEAEYQPEPPIDLRLVLIGEGAGL